MKFPLFAARLRWLSEPVTVWICAALTAVVVSGCGYWPVGNLEQRLRWTGMIFQLLGLATVAIGIGQMRRLFNHPSVWSQIKAWITRWPVRGNRTIELSGQATSTSGGHTDLQLRAGPGATLEQRVHVLETRMTAAEQREEHLSKEQARQAQDHRRALDAERSARESADEEHRKRLEVSATGGLLLSGIGLVWLIIGTILASASPEIAGSHIEIVAAPTAISTLRGTLVWESIYWTGALVASTFFGLKTFEIWSIDATNMDWPTRFWQHWLNFLGSLVGWSAGWPLVERLHVCAVYECGLQITLGAAMLFIVAFLGVTGYLPYAMVGLATHIGDVVRKASGLERGE